MHKLSSFVDLATLKALTVMLPIILTVAGILSLNTNHQQVKVANVPIASQTNVADLAKQIKQEAESYRLTIESPDKTQHRYTLAEMGIGVNYQASADKALKYKSGLGWLEDASQSGNAPLVLNVNQAKLDNFLKTQASTLIQPPKDAAITIAEGRSQVTKEVNGKKLALKEDRQAILEIIKSLKPVSLKQQVVSIKPAIKRDNLVSAKKQVEVILNKDYTFYVQGNEITATPEEVAAWLQFEPKNKGVEVNVNTEALQKYIDLLAEPYATAGRPAVVIDNQGASTTLREGQSGTGVINKPELVSELAASLKDRQGANLSLEIGSSPTEPIVVDGVGKALAVDLAAKRLYAVENGAIAQTYLVSAGAPGTPTVTGKYSIFRKEAKQDMRGANADGSDYFQPDVQWVNYFYQDYAVHGNYWRPAEYFGNINSSHGCVGITNSDAEWIYNWAPIGTPVVVFN